MGEFPLRRRSFQRGRQPQTEPLKQDQLVLRRLADATSAQVAEEGGYGGMPSRKRTLRHRSAPPRMLALLGQWQRGKRRALSAGYRFRRQSSAAEYRSTALMMPSRP